MPTIYNKIELDGTTLLDLSQDTASSASHIRSGYTAHLNDGTQVTGTYSGGTPTLQAKTKTYTPTETAQTESVSADSGYDGLDTVSISVGAIDSNYVGTGITRRSSTDLTASGATVTVPSGYYASNASKAVASGRIGNPSWSNEKTTTQFNITASYPQFTEGYISSINNAIRAFTLQEETVTPSTTTQIIEPSTANSYLNKVTVEAMPSGTAGTPTASKGSVSNHSISVTPSVTNTTGYITGSTKTGTAVTVSASELVSGSETKTSNGTYDVTNLAELVVNVSGDSPTIQSLSITPSETAQTFNASGVDGYKPVSVSAISSTYVGSGITQRSSTDLTVSGATVTAPAGYYSAAASKSVSSMTLPTSAASSATSGYTSKATIGRSTAAQYINIPPGYNSAGAYYVISAVANGSATAPASISGTAASISTGTNTLTLTKTVSVTPTVSAGYVSAGTAGNSSVSLTASVTTKAAATITPTTTNQTIAAGTYITGTQTIAGDADLVGSNILSTANIFGVQGTVVVQNYYTGSSAPSSSTGSNGDLYLQS